MKWPFIFDEQGGLDEGGYLRLIASDSVNGHWRLVNWSAVRIGVGFERKS